MHIHSLITCVVLLLAPWVSASASADEIAWNDKLSEAKQQAKTSGKLIMVDFYTSWCGPCQAMDEEVYPNPTVVKAASPFIAVRLNAEKGGVKAAKEYNVHSYPTILFLNASGQVFDKISGSPSAPRFTFLLNRVLQEYQEYPQLHERLQEYPEDVNAITKIAARLVRVGQVEEVETRVSALEELVGAETLGATYNAIAASFLEARDQKSALRWYEKTFSHSNQVHEIFNAHMARYNLWRSQRNSSKMENELKVVLTVPNLLAKDKEHAQRMLDNLSKENQYKPQPVPTLVA